MSDSYKTFEINEIQVLGGGARDRRDVIIQRRRQRDGSSLWSINERGNRLNHRGDWELELQPSSRTDAYLKRTRWPTLDAAIEAWQRFSAKALADD